MIEDYEKSLEQLDTCLAHNPKNIPVHTVKCHCLLKLGRCDEVINYFDAMPSDIVVTRDKLGLTGLAYALKKDSANTAKYLNQLLEETNTSPAGFNSNSYLFLMYAVMGENEKAFEWVRLAIENKSSLLLLRFSDPLVNSIKDNKRYLEFHKILFP
jgi:tetratricopeptide (TPR) repeat protein